MLLKRKRSANILSSPTSTLTSSPPSPGGVQSFYPHTKPTTCTSPFASSKPLSFELDSTPSHLNIRTRKRHRDNRPEAAAVHASTIQRLYQAQQRAASVDPPLQPTQQQHAHEQQQHQNDPTPTQHHQQPPPPQKSTLHSFWHIPQPLPTAPQPQQAATHLSAAAPEEARCEDCDGSLIAEDAMDVDDSAVEDKACGSCRRPVCDNCAVIGRERVCGGCAGCERGW